MPSIYTPLDSRNGEIRLLTILRGSHTVKCRLDKRNLSQQAGYTALSYCWEDGEALAKIIVNGVAVRVSANLEKALRRLRGTSKRVLWVDALCINQADNRERSLQVRLMQRIYSGATQTIAWLGQPESDEDDNEDGASLAISLLQILDINWEAPEDVEDACVCGGGGLVGTYAHWHANHVGNHRGGPPTPVSTICQDCVARLLCHYFGDIVSHGYWKRRWVMQEVAASRQVLVTRGQDSIDIDHMRRGLSLCLASRHWCLSIHDTLFSHMHEVFRYRDDFQRDRLPSLWTLFLDAQRFHSSDPRDMFFAVIGLSRDGTHMIPNPDYNQSISTIARDLVRALIRQRGCFDLLFIDQRERSSTDTIPSWLPNILTTKVPRAISLIPDRPPLVDVSFAAESVSGHPSTIKLHGVSLGFIVNATSVLAKERPPDVTEFTTGLQVMPLGTKTKKPKKRPVDYYGWTWNVRGAILTAILSNRCETTHLYRHRGAISVHQYQRLVKEGQAPNSEAPRAYSKWFQHNDRFVIGKATLRAWLSQSLISYYLSKLEENITGRYRFTLQWTLLGGAPIVLTTLWYFHFMAWHWAMIVATVVMESSRVLDPGYADEVVDKVLQEAKSSSEVVKRLAVLHSGIICQSGEYSQVGDEVCMIAGLSTPVVLRRGTDNLEGHYRWVGQASAYLSKSDGKRYRFFVSSTRGNPDSAEVKKALIKDARKLDDWEEFLVA